MANLNVPQTVQSQLNRMSPPASRAKLGDALADLIAENNRLQAQVAELTTNFNAVLAKLDADDGLDDSDYVSEQGAAAFTATTITDLESRHSGA